MKSFDKKYYIVDFVASRRYFHQYPLIIGISHFLSKNGHEPIVLLPYIADKMEAKFTRGDINYVLDAGYSSRDSKIMRHLFLKLLTITCRNQQSGQRIKARLRQAYIKSGLEYFQNIKKSENESKHIIFPTLDPLSLQLALKLSLESKMDDYHFYFRIIGSESRGILASSNELKSLLDLVKLYPRNIRIGVETIGYKSYLEDLGFETSCIYWSPWPSLNHLNKAKLVNKSKRLLIGFLGCAKQRKGFDNIPKILKQLKSNGVNFSILIQEANFPWVGYEKTINDISLVMGSEFEFLPSNLELVELLESINQCDLLILPYDANSYSINASGVLYHACDYSVPMITAKGVGFASEIENFNLGLTYNNLDEISGIVEKVQIIKSDFLSYNSERDKANHRFLFE